jgi:hypothetical protein
MNAVLLGWPYLGLLAAPLIVLWLATERRPAGAPASRWDDPASVLPLLWPMYLVHQFEEHGVDLLGRRYSFLGELCRTLGHAADPSHCPADPAFIFAVNAVGCQITFACAAIFRRRAPLIAACAWGVAIVNAATHLGSAVAHRAYNPGAFTSAVLFVPLSAWMVRTVVRAGVVRRAEVARVVATGAILHAVLLGSLALAERGALPRAGLLLVNALNGLWPLALGTVGVSAPRANAAAVAER